MRKFQIPGYVLVNNQQVSSKDQDLITRKVIDALNEAGLHAVEVAESDGESDVVLVGKITQFTRGSRGLRYLGSGGAARFAVQGQALRRDGSLLGEFGANRYADFGLFGGNSDTLLSYCVDAVAIDVANMVVSGQYQQLQNGVVLGAGALVHP